MARKKGRGSACGEAGAGEAGGAARWARGAEVRWAATRRDGEELLITTIDKHGAVTLAAQAAARPGAHLRLLRTHELQRPIAPAAADTPVEFATYQQREFVETRASSAAADRAERQGVGPFEQVPTVLKRNGAKVVTGLTGRATLQTAQGDPISFEGRINAEGNFECVVRGPKYRSTEI